MRGGSAWAPDMAPETATATAATVAPSHAMRTAREYRGPSLRAIAQRRERADEVARRLLRISVLADQRVERRLGPRSGVGRQARLVARQQLDQVADPLGDRLPVALEVRVAQLAEQVGEDLAHHRLLAAVVERPRADLGDHALAEVLRAPGDLEGALDLLHHVLVGVLH